LFNDLEGDLKNTFEGENRLSNIIAYTTPPNNGFSATIAMIPAEAKILIKMAKMTPTSMMVCLIRSAILVTNST
jgi:hypothetical protein